MRNYDMLITSPNSNAFRGGKKTKRRLRKSTFSTFKKGGAKSTFKKGRAKSTFKKGRAKKSLKMRR
jgi:hypothetical protein